MNKKAISIQNISKKYLVGKQKDGSLRGTLNSLFQSNKQKTEEFYALQDVSFDVMQGDVVGIIGKNGAGKSTLLKILSQITKPSAGRIELNGRVASLLEVGTGFHPELTGRENVYLNGTILGMTRKEVTQKFDEIVAFSGVEKFIDTPVKHYSSGMYVRLAFAVAAHLEPEILIIDEVLAVGDAEFQKKCLGKMKDVAGEGRTVLFVSHNMAALKSLCQTGVVLNKGKVVYEGNIDNAISNYLQINQEESANEHFYTDVNSDVFHLHSIVFNNSNKSSKEDLIDTEEVEFTSALEMKIDNVDFYHLTYVLYNEYGEALFSLSHATNDVPLVKGMNNLKCVFPAQFLQSGNYALSLYIIEGKAYSHKIVHNVASFRINEGGNAKGGYTGREPGFIRPVFEWTNTQL